MLIKVTRFGQFFLADRLLSPFPFFRSSLPFVSLARKEDPPSCSPSLSPLQPSLAQVSAFKMILFFTSRFLCTTPFLRPPPHPRLGGEKIKRGTNTIFKPSFRGERTPQPGIKPPEYSCFRGTPTRFSFAIISFFSSTFFLDASDKKDWWA